VDKPQQIAELIVGLSKKEPWWAEQTERQVLSTAEY